MENLKRPAVLLNLILIALLAFLLLRDCNTTKPELEANNIDLQRLQKDLISNDKVFEFYKNFNKKDSVVNHYMRNATGRGDFNDTRSVVFEFNVLHDYLEYIKQISKEHKVTPKGIKVTFGSFKNNGNTPFQSNVFFTPTKSNGRAESSYTISNGKIVLFKDLKKKPNVQQGGFILSRSFQDDGLGLNGGKPVPPPHSEDPDFN